MQNPPAYKFLMRSLLRVIVGCGFLFLTLRFMIPDATMRDKALLVLVMVILLFAADFRDALRQKYRQRR
jgi:hypothetical protein